jgi:deazaflavin-dependent oxidoreductase (nitroreductase family)
MTTTSRTAPDSGSQRNLPTAVRRLNPLVMPLLRLGLPIGPMYLLTVNGRRTGVPRTTPVATFEYEGRRYVAQAVGRAGWVANVRAAGWGLLGRGRRRPRVSLVEVPVDERGPMLRHAASMAPAPLRRQFVDQGLADAPTPDAIAAGAGRIAVFRVDGDAA